MAGRSKSIQALRRELEAKERQLKKLQLQRAKATGALDAIDRKIAALSGQVAPTAPKKPKAAKKMPRKAVKVAAAQKMRKPAKGDRLVDYLVKVLSGSAGMRAKNIQAAVSKAGYRSVSKDFYNIVAATLRDKKLFQRVKRGVYKLK